MPAWHGFAGVQASPVVHDMQVPELHTMFVPQEVPLATFADSTHTAVPLPHAVMPVRHGLLGTAQIAPTLQSPQTPVALQTLPTPQAVPAGTMAVPALQTGVPVPQASVP